ncbi:hypothetical protein ACWCRF_06820 [Streptomyces sp. NPDC002405]|uniref:hypothetical protein n=1 Tax=Streptomyces sp. NPDC057596 TaxID=3346178 RepID=UPI0036C0429C
MDGCPHGSVGGVCLVDDPKLPRPELDKAAAEKRAEALTHLKPGSPVSLIAQEVYGEWRPVWIVNMIQEGESKPWGSAVHLDAVSGKMVQPED